jgi:hypothetical protein
MKKLSLFLLAITFAPSAFANQSYYVSCAETYVNPMTGEELSPETQKKWRRFTLKENKTIERRSKLDREHIFQITTEGAYDVSLGATARALGSVELPRGFDFDVLFGAWPGGKAPDVAMNRDLDEGDSKNKGEPQDQFKDQFKDQLPPPPPGQFRQLGLVPAGVRLTSKGGLRIKTMFKPGYTSKARTLPTPPETATVLNWGNSNSRTVQVFQPQGSTELVKLVCDRMEKVR